MIRRRIRRLSDRPTVSAPHSIARHSRLVPRFEDLFRVGSCSGSGHAYSFAVVTCLSKKCGRALSGASWIVGCGESASLGGRASLEMLVGQLDLL